MKVIYHYLCVCAKAIARGAGGCTAREHFHLVPGGRKHLVAMPIHRQVVWRERETRVVCMAASFTPAFPPAPPHYPSAATPPRTAVEIASVWYTVVADFFITNSADSLREFGPALPTHFTTPASAWFWVLLLLVCCLLPYLAFQAHLLPHCCGKWVGRTYFYPCLPCTLWHNKHEFKSKWWSYIDEGDDGSPPVLMGSAPLFVSQLRELDMLGVAAVVNL